MIGILRSIADVITSVLHLIINTITSIWQLFIRIPTYVSFLTTSFSFLPNSLFPFCVASVSIFVIFLIINRGN